MNKKIETTEWETKARVKSVLMSNVYKKRLKNIRYAITQSRKRLLNLIMNDCPSNEYQNNITQMEGQRFNPSVFTRKKLTSRNEINDRMPLKDVGNRRY